MKIIMKNEWRKSISSRGWWLALVIGITLALAQAFMHVPFIRQVEEGVAFRGYAHPCGYESVTLNILWMGVDGYTAVSNAFYMVLPILAAMPMAASKFQEEKNGYMIQMVTRCGRKKYFMGKWYICFLTGGCVIAIPLLINLMVKAMICPIGRVTSLSFQSPLQGYFCSQLYYSHPLLYMGMVLFLDFMWGGICAVLALGIGGRIKNAVLIIVMPFLILMVLDVAIQFVHRWIPVNGYELSPRGLFLALSLNKNPLWEEMLYMLVIYGIALVFYLMQNRKAVLNERISAKRGKKRYETA